MSAVLTTWFVSASITLMCGLLLLRTITWARAACWVGVGAEVGVGLPPVRNIEGAVGVADGTHAPTLKTNPSKIDTWKNRVHHIVTSIPGAMNSFAHATERCATRRGLTLQSSRQSQVSLPGWVSLTTRAHDQLQPRSPDSPWRVSSLLRL